MTLKSAKKQVIDVQIVQHHSLLNSILRRTFDGRVSIRRWSSMTFAWLFKGQYLSLNIIIKHILESTKSWNDIFAPNTGSRMTHTRKSKSPKKVNENKAYPDDVNPVVLSCRIIKLCSEAGSSCGARSPTGGIEVFHR